MSSSAPKFASFRPKPKAPEQPPPEEPRREEKDHRKRKSSRERKRDERPSPQRDTQRDGSSRKPYFSDRRGDRDIVKYGTLNRYDIPSYRRSGYGNVLGLPDQKIDRENSTDKSIGMTPLVRQRQKRMLTDKHAAKESKRTLRLVKVAETHQSDATRDFIALSNTERRKRRASSDSEERDDATPDQDYRRLDEKRDPDKVDDPDTYYESDTEAASAVSEVTQKNSRLIRETRDDPGNLQAWLDLVEHQELMMKLDRAITELSAADRQNLADVRISTYEEALRKVGSDEASQIELQVGLLREAQRHWDDAKVAAKWHDVLEKHPHSVKLWFGYIDFVQSTFSRFKYEDCRVAFSRALQALQSTNFTDDTTMSEARMHLFVRLTTMIQEAGYQELALAAWQAVLEFHHLAPQDSTADKTQQFEEFWESEAPRIGEPDSKGWRHTSIDDAIPPTCTVSLETSGSPNSSTDDFRTRETESISKLRYPGRSTDDVGEDDPFHTIFFSDLKDFVTKFPAAPPEKQVDAFLCFCGLPPLAGMRLSGPWWDDPYLQSRKPDFKPSAETDSENMQYAEALSRYSQSPLARFQMTSELLVRQSFSLEASRLSPNFLRNVLKLLATNIPGSEFIGEYLLAFESKHFPSEVAKSAKRLLKGNPSSVRLYNTYGLVESHLGNIVKADQVFAAALNINGPPADHLQLLSNYVWQALYRDDKVEALRRLASLKGNPLLLQTSRPESALIETVRSTFQATLEEALLKKDLASAIFNAALLALLVYLSGDGNATAALEVHSNLTAWFASHKLTSSTHAEMHAQAIARLLAHHASHTSIVKPSLLRTALDPLIAIFPSNTILLSTFAANEARFSIDDRVRGTMHRVLHTAPTLSIATWAFAIHHETLRGALAGSTSHSIRALYTRATDRDASGARCPALWALYLRFELAQLRDAQRLRPDTRPSRDGKKSTWQVRIGDAADRARATFYKGLKMMPWCKDFVMLAFTAAREVFTADELRRLHGVMLEMEMRLYTEVDEAGFV